jgi:hypothetical protein
MTLHTIMPLEIVLNGVEQQRESTIIEILVDGVTLEVEPLNATQAAIVRLRSGNPQDYLNPHYTPGRIIDFQPVT